MTSQLRIHCSRHNLQEVRDFVRQFLLAEYQNEILVNQVVLAIDEVVANFIIHGNAENADQFLDLILGIADHRLEVEIEDHSANLFVPPTEAPKPDMSEHIKQARKGGMGMALVSRIMDHVTYFERNAHTVCHLSKKLK
jgi:serine/threonine-protein kinase RsbW